MKRLLLVLALGVATFLYGALIPAPARVSPNPAQTLPPGLTIAPGSIPGHPVYGGAPAIRGERRQVVP